MTYTEAIDSLFVMLENVCSEMDYVVLVEGADSGVSTSEQKSKIKTLGNAIVKIATQIWETIKKAILKFKDFIVRNIINKVNVNSKISLTGDYSLSYGFVDLCGKSSTIPTLMTYALTGKIEQSKIDKVNELFDSLEEYTVVRSKELSFRYIDVVKALDKYAALSTSLRNHVNDLTNIDDDVVRDNAINLIKRFDEFIKTLNYDFNRVSNGEVTSENRNKLSKARVRSASNGASEYVERLSRKRMNKKVNAESVDLSDDTRIMCAKLLIEAASLLKGDNIIPEEVPVVAREYPEDISGGEGRADDYLEDIKDLVNDDSEAMDILTKNDQSKTITESIDLVFDL